jgi:hypothetical protein
MNRLVIIGNGFDLAHNLKTRYSDFMLGLLKHELLIAEKKKPRQVGNNTTLDATDVEYQGTKLFTIHKDLRLKGDALRNELFYIKGFGELNQFFQYKNIKILFPDALPKGESGGGSIPYDSILKTLFNGLTTGDMKWVDVEGTYYEHLKNIINRFSKDGQRYYDQNARANLAMLHKEFHYLKKQLESYLTAVMKSAPENFGSHDAHFWTSIKGAFSKSEQDRLGIMETEKYPKAIHILNFNYTDTLYKYGQHNLSFENHKAPVDFNFIHGEINKADNPLIFGYGDETDEHYSVLEKLNDNQLFEHIKSFGYFRTVNYHRLLRFLEADDYQVYIIGHSCGLSDRVMLKHIFEHEHCRSIQIFYHKREDGTDDYVEKTHEISRHFEDKRAMREKIVPKPTCLPVSGLGLSHIVK